MAADAIFMTQGEDLVKLEETPYEKEMVLQRALERFPEVLAGSATTADGSSGKLLLLRREMPVPDAKGTWSMSLDHLFVDASATPVLVEVKRSTDTRIRREVVGQMFDYAANAVKYWPVEVLRRYLPETTQSDDADQPVRDAFGQDVDVDEFWRQLEQNLRNGRIRMIFVADKPPDDLVRIIEFLNSKMQDVELLGVEVPRFVSGETHIYVPRVVGVTAAAVDIKSGGTPGPHWSRQTFLSGAEERGRPAGELAVWQRLFDHVERNGGTFNWGRGASAGVSGWYPIGGVQVPIWNTSTGTGTGASRPYLILYFDALVSRKLQDKIEVVASRLSQDPAWAVKIADAKQKSWVAQPSAYVDDLAAADNAPGHFSTLSIRFRTPRTDASRLSERPQQSPRHTHAIGAATTSTATVAVQAPTGVEARTRSAAQEDSVERCLGAPWPVDLVRSGPQFLIESVVDALRGVHGRHTCRGLTDQLHTLLRDAEWHRLTSPSRREARS